MSVPQSGMIDNRDSLSADRFSLNGSSAYPWYANNQLATCAIEPAVALNGSTTDALGQNFEYSHATISFDVAPPSGTTFEVQEYISGAWTTKLKHYVSLADGIQVVPFGYRFIVGEKVRVGIFNGGTTANKSIVLHNPR